MIVDFDDLPNYANHVLVDGAFDPLHAGHVAYLQAARALNKGPLLCSVASDDQIREKGREPLLPQSSRVAVLEALCDAVYAKDRPTEDVIRQMRPTAYVKGADWRNRLPDGQLLVCAEGGFDVVYINTPLDSSTARLRAWALKDAEQSLDRLEQFMAAQTDTPIAKFDHEYFAGQWRADGNVYTYDKRKEVEGRHPELIADVFRGCSIMDYGCGPGYLLQMLRERGMDARGYEPSMAAWKMADPLIRRRIKNFLTSYRDDDWLPSDFNDVVICREVLEHLAVWRVAETVEDIFAHAKKYVYITTRFSSDAVFDAETDFETDPTHITCLSQPFLRALCVLNGGKRRADLESMLDWQKKGRCLVYEVSR